MAIPLLQRFLKSREGVERAPILPSRSFIQESNEVGGGRGNGGGNCYDLIYLLPYDPVFLLKLLGDPNCDSPSVDALYLSPNNPPVDS